MTATWPRAGRVKSALKHFTTVHRQGPDPNIVIVSAARSGTSWLAEMLATQGRFKIVNEPCNLRIPVNRENLGIDAWRGLFLPENKARLRHYLRGFIEGRDTDLRFKRETPFSAFWHPVTDRVLFKILFAGEDDVDWLRRELNAHLIYLLRHPIPVALSRTEFPRLESFLEPPFSDHFSGRQLSHARDIVASHDTFLIAVLDWCLQNALPLRQRRQDWIVVSYEQLVLEPEVVIAHLATTLSLARPQRMLTRLYRASGSTTKSHVESRRVLQNPSILKESRRWLVDKWKDRVTPAQVDAAFCVLQTFDIHFYEKGSSMPPLQFLVGHPAS